MSITFPQYVHQYVRPGLAFTSDSVDRIIADYMESVRTKLSQWGFSEAVAKSGEEILEKYTAHSNDIDLILNACPTDKYGHDRMLEGVEDFFRNRRLEEVSPKEWEGLLCQMNKQLLNSFENSILTLRMNVGSYRTYDVPMPVQDIPYLVDHKKHLTPIEWIWLQTIPLDKNELFCSDYHNNRFNTEQRQVIDKCYYMPPHFTKIAQQMRIFAGLLSHKLKNHDDPLQLATFAHMGLIRIMPFSKGNGRIARCLMNLILIKNKRHPMIFLSRRDYINAVVQDRKTPGSFLKYIEKKHEILENKKNSWTVVQLIKARALGFI